ncbi:L,D-transpeptidase [Nocardioides conyzicola]|uniref:L,D-TPase catalytic domain-containing protein n=1 Tax=Nocardioides conyzicola TaxID=1651781 RepID=A0ABP8WSB9_9ACTN
MTEPRGAHRAVPVRPRYGRLTALGVSLAVTTIALLGSFGALPFSDGGAAAQKSPTDNAAADLGATAHLASDAASPSTSEPASTSAADVEPMVDPADDTTVPADSGDGRRVVFSQSRQRVWLIGDHEKVKRTYLVSGSAYDNLDPGSYQVYSRSEQAWGVDDSGTMKYFVRFAQGDHAAIGFHDIPVDDGKPVQTVAQLGTPLSHGCIRQKEADAVALWKFAPLGTDVVVTA